jgi:hypothetical protein
MASYLLIAITNIAENESPELWQMKIDKSNEQMAEYLHISKTLLSKKDDKNTAYFWLLWGFRKTKLVINKEIDLVLYGETRCFYEDLNITTKSTKDSYVLTRASPLLEPANFPLNVKYFFTIDKEIIETFDD